MEDAENVIHTMPDIARLADNLDRLSNWATTVCVNRDRLVLEDICKTPKCPLNLCLVFIFDDSNSQNNSLPSRSNSRKTAKLHPIPVRPPGRIQREAHYQQWSPSPTGTCPLENVALGPTEVSQRRRFVRWRTRWARLSGVTTHWRRGVQAGSSARSASNKSWRRRPWTKTSGRHQ